MSLWFSNRPMGFRGRRHPSMRRFSHFIVVALAVLAGVVLADGRGARAQDAATPSDPSVTYCDELEALRLNMDAALGYLQENMSKVDRIGLVLDDFIAQLRSTIADAEGAERSALIEELEASLAQRLEVDRMVDALRQQISETKHHLEALNECE